MGSLTQVEALKVQLDRAEKRCLQLTTERDSMYDDNLERIQKEAKLEWGIEERDLKIKDLEDKLTQVSARVNSLAHVVAYPDLLAACKEFVRKVECGEAKSSKSYAQMKEAIGKAAVAEKLVPSYHKTLAATLLNLYELWLGAETETRRVAVMLTYTKKQLALIAAFHDKGGSDNLVLTGSYGLFDEPSAVKVSREALRHLESLETADNF